MVHNTLPSVQPWPDRTEFSSKRNLLRRHSTLLFEIATPKDFFRSTLFTRQNEAIVDILAPAMLFLRLYLAQKTKDLHLKPGNDDHSLVHFSNIMTDLSRMVAKRHYQYISDMKGTINKQDKSVKGYGPYHHLGYCYDTTEHNKEGYEELLAKWTLAPRGRQKRVNRVNDTPRTIKWMKRP